MGTRPADKLKEIEQVRSQLDAKVAELERRLPALADVGKRAASVAIGGGAGGGVIWFLLRRRRARKKKKKDGDDRRKEGFAAPTVVVHGLPKGLVPIVVGSVAVWAAVRIFEIKRLRQDAAGDSAVVTPIAERQAR